MARGRMAFLLATAAVAWCLGCATLFVVTDLPALAIVPAVGAAVCTLAWFGLRAFCSRGAVRGKRATTACVHVLLVIGVVGVSFGGFYLVPAAAMLAAAALLVPPPALRLT